MTRKLTYWTCLMIVLYASHPCHVQSLESRSKVKALQGAAGHHRVGKFIWPFSSFSSPTTEKSPSGNFFVDEETPLPAGLDLSGHPLWKIHKYQGFDLRPVQMQHTDSYPMSDPKIVTNVNGKLQYSPYTPADFGGSDSSGVEKPQYSPYTPADFGGSDSSGVGKPQYSPYTPADFGGSDSSGVAAETEPVPDLSFLDDLGGLAYFLPDVEESAEAPETQNWGPTPSTESPPSGFFNSWFSGFRKQPGTTTLPPAAEPVKPEGTSTSPGFFSSWFGSKKQQQAEDPEKTEQDFSTTLFLPKTKGSYVAVKAPAGMILPESGFLQGPTKKVPVIPLNEAPAISYEDESASIPFNLNYPPAATQFGDKETVEGAFVSQGLEKLPLQESFDPRIPDSSVSVQRYPSGAYSVHIKQVENPPASDFTSPEEASPSTVVKTPEEYRLPSMNPQRDPVQEGQAITQQTTARVPENVTEEHEPTQHPPIKEATNFYADSYGLLAANDQPQEPHRQRQGHEISEEASDFGQDWSKRMNAGYSKIRQ